MANFRRHRAPLWTRLTTVLGSVMLVLSGGALVAKEAVLARFDKVQDAGLLDNGGNGAEEIKGPINVLMVGIDPRDEDTPPLADSIIIAHIPASMDQAILFSVPRDLYVDIPATGNGAWNGGKGKINGAMSVGSIVPGGKPDAALGFKHLAKTVTQVTGVEIFDAGAIVNFGGFKNIVEALGGVTMTLDQDFSSEHLQPNGKPRARLPECADNHCQHPYIGPAKQYEKGRQRLEAWEALDVVRQRYTLKNGDYDRQKNQQRFVRAIAEEALSKDVVTDPAKLLKVIDAAGESLTFSGGGHDIVDWALAMRDVNPKNMVTVKLGGGAVSGESGQYLGEQLQPGSDRFFRAVAENTVSDFLVHNPEFLNMDQ